MIFEDNKEGVIEEENEGWRGDFKGVLEKKIEEMIGIGEKSENIVEVIGKKIGKEN